MPGPGAAFPSLPRFSSLLVLACIGCLDTMEAAGPAQSYVYKQVDALEIKADVYRPTGFTGPRPVLVWMHGGALMSGSRTAAEKHPLTEAMIAAGGVVVAIDYRLAPEVPLPEIIRDVEDAFRWVREQGPALFSADQNRIVTGGSSAGAYLALTAGYRVTPRPNAVISYWGYGDLTGSWYREPSTQPRHLRTLLSRDEAYRPVSGAAVANGTDRTQNAGENFYYYCRQHGLWPQAVSGGWDPQSEPEKFHPYMPLMNVSNEYPPTLLIHGLKDTDVPCEQSRLMAAELEKHGVEHQFITDPDADHGSNWSPEATAATALAAIEFIRAHVK